MNDFTKGSPPPSAPIILIGCAFLLIILSFIGDIYAKRSLTEKKPEPPTTYCAMEVTYREITAGELVESSICMEISLID